MMKTITHGITHFFNRVTSGRQGIAHNHKQGKDQQEERSERQASQQQEGGEQRPHELQRKTYGPAEITQMVQELNESDYYQKRQLTFEYLPERQKIRVIYRGNQDLDRFIPAQNIAALMGEHKGGLINIST